ncbi:MAG: hypothetical protein AAB641_00065 [Patescibacteria group bacterium]
MPKKGIIVSLLVLAGLFGGIFLFRNSPAPSGNQNEEAIETKGNEITVMGVIACLPYRINIEGQECVKGIKGDDGKVYALNSPTGVENTMNEGTKVTARGVFQPANTSVDDSASFIYDGVLVVKILQKR